MPYIPTGALVRIEEKLLQSNLDFARSFRLMAEAIEDGEISREEIAAFLRLASEQFEALAKE